MSDPHEKSKRRMFFCSASANLALGLALALAGTASGQTAFNAQVRGHITLPSGCPGGADLCGQAIVAGLGPAEYLFFVGSFDPTTASRPCGVYTPLGDYTATTTFTLGDGSTLTLDEAGTVCGPGNSFPTGGISFGNPRTFSASWEVLDATGQFAGMTGSGTDTGLTAGSALKAVYSESF